MKRKLNSFEILKLDSKRLKDYNYEISINARDEFDFLNFGERIKVSESTFTTKAQHVAGKKVDFERVSEIDNKFIIGSGKTSVIIFSPND